MENVFRCACDALPGVFFGSDCEGFAILESSFQAAPVVRAPAAPDPRADGVQPPDVLSPSVYLPVALSPVVQSLRRS